MRCWATVTQTWLGTWLWRLCLKSSIAISGCAWQRVARRSLPPRPSPFIRVSWMRSCTRPTGEPPRAVRILKRARSAEGTAGEADAFSGHVWRLREQYRRRPTLIAMLDKANLP
jgi:hypothetical protein